MGEFGVEIENADGGFRNIYDIMKDLSVAFSNSSDEFRKQLILEELAGKRRANVLAGLLNNWEKAEQVKSKALKSSTEAEEKQQRLLETSAGQIEKMSSNWQIFSENVIKSDLARKAFAAINTALDGINDKMEKNASMSNIYEDFDLQPEHIGKGYMIDLEEVKNLTKMLTSEQYKKAIENKNKLLASGDDEAMSKFLTDIREQEKYIKSRQQTIDSSLQEIKNIKNELANLDEEFNTGTLVYADYLEQKKELEEAIELEEGYIDVQHRAQVQIARSLAMQGVHYNELGDDIANFVKAIDDSIDAESESTKAVNEKSDALFTASKEYEFYTKNYKMLTDEQKKEMVGFIQSDIDKTKLAIQNSRRRLEMYKSETNIYTNLIQEQINKLKEKTGAEALVAEKKLMHLQNSAKNLSEEDGGLLDKKIEAEETKLNSLNSALDELNKKYSKYGNSTSSGGGSSSRTELLTKEEMALENITSQYNVLNTILGNTTSQQKRGEILNQLISLQQQRIEKIKNARKEVIAEINNTKEGTRAYQALVKERNSISESIAKESGALIDLNSQLEDNLGVMNEYEYKQELLNATLGNTTNEQDKLNIYRELHRMQQIKISSIKKEIRIQKDLIDTTRKGTLENKQAIASYQDLTVTLQNAGAKLSEYKSKIDSIHQQKRREYIEKYEGIYKDLQEDLADVNEKLSEEQKIADDLSDSINTLNGLFEEMSDITSDSNYVFADDDVQNMLEAIDAFENINIDFFSDDTLQTTSELREEIENMSPEELTDKFDELKTSTDTALGFMGEYFTRLENVLQEKLDSSEQRIEGFNDVIDSISKHLNDLDFDSSFDNIMSDLDWSSSIGDLKDGVDNVLQEFRDINEVQVFVKRDFHSEEENDNDYSGILGDASPEEVQELTNKYQEYYKGLDGVYSDYIDNLNDNKDAEIKAIEDAKDAEIKSINAQIEARKRLKEEDDYLEDKQDYLDKIAELEKEQAMLAIDNSLAADKRRDELAEELAETREGLSELEEDRQYELDIQSLEDQKNTITDNAKTQIEEINTTYDNKQSKIEETFALEKAKIEEILLAIQEEAEAKIDAEEEYQDSIQETYGQQRSEIIDTVEQIENAYEEQMNIMEDILSQKQENLNSLYEDSLENIADWKEEIAELEDEIDDIQDNLSGSSGGSSGGGGSGGSDGVFSDDGEPDPQIGTDEERQEVSDRIEEETGSEPSSDIIDDVIKRENTRYMHDGGVIGDKSFKNMNIMDYIYDLKSDEVPIIGQVGEVVATQEDMSTIASNISSGGVSLNIDNLNVQANNSYDVENVGRDLVRGAQIEYAKRG